MCRKVRKVCHSSGPPRGGYTTGETMRINIFYLVLIQLCWSPKVCAEERGGLLPDQFFSEIVFLPGAGDYIVSSINQSAKRSSKDLYLRFGARLKTPVTIIVGRDLELLYKEISDVLEGDVNFSELSAVYDAQCNRSIGGFSRAKVVVICLSRELNGVSRGIDLPKSITALEFNAELTEIISHEAFHAFQLQATGVEEIQPYYENLRFGSPGPYWLLEGSALYVGLRSSFSTTDVRKIASLAKLNGATNLEPCEVIVKYQNAFSIDGGVSGETLSMISQLADRFGEELLSEFYIAIGETGDWNLAFKMTFAETPDSIFSCKSNNQASGD